MLVPRPPAMLNCALVPLVPFLLHPIHTFGSSGTLPLPLCDPSKGHWQCLVGPQSPWINKLANWVDLSQPISINSTKALASFSSFVVLGSCRAEFLSRWKLSRPIIPLNCLSYEFLVLRWILCDTRSLNVLLDGLFCCIVHQNSVKVKAVLRNDPAWTVWVHQSDRSLVCCFMS